MLIWLYKSKCFCFSFQRPLSNTASCLSLEHSISHNPSHWLVEKNRENVLAATLYNVCLQQHNYPINDVKTIGVSVTTEDIYQHCKQFQHFLMLATLTNMLIAYYHCQTKIFSPTYVLILFNYRQNIF